MAINLRSVCPVDPLLTQFVVDYTQQQDYFIADKLFPVVPVKNETGTYYDFHATKDKYRLIDLGVTRRAPGAAYHRGTLNAASATYTTQEDGEEIAVDDRLEANAIAPYSPRRAAAETAAEQILLRREMNAITSIINVVTFAAQTAAVPAADRWSNINSTPITYFDTIANTVRGNCGFWPNTVVMAWDVWLQIKNHPDITDLIKNTNDKIVTVDLLARVFNVKRILIAGAMRNTAEEGQAVTLADMMTARVFLGYVTESPDLSRPSVGYNIQRSGLEAKTYREEQTNSEIARVTVNEIQQVVAADCGYLLTTVI